MISFCVAVGKHLSAGSLGLGRPSVPPLNLDAAKLVAGDPRDAPSTQRLKTLSSSRLSRRLKMEARKRNFHKSNGRKKCKWDVGLLDL